VKEQIFIKGGIMKKLIFILFIFLILINFVSAEIDEKALQKNVKQSIIKEFLEDLGITTKVSEEINKTNPQIMQDLNDICEKTSGMLFLIGVLTLGTILGLIYFYPAGIVLGIVDLLAIINYFCWFSI
jgi:hypothetical protein